MRILCKRAMKRLLIFALLLVAPVLAVQVSTAESPPSAGFYLVEESPAAERVREHLLKNGFVPIDDPEALLEQVRQGALDCGAAFPEDISARISQGQLKGSVDFYRSPTSFSPDLYKSHIAAILFREYVPYICASAFAQTTVTQEEVLAEYEAMFDYGYVFSFDVVTSGGDREGQAVKNKTMAIGASAILTFAALFAMAAETADRAVMQLLPRLGLWKSITRVLLPETTAQLALAAIFAGGGLALAGLPELWLPAAVYCVAVWSCGIVLYSILWSAKRIYVLLPVLVIASAALCPIYTDLSILLPWLNRVRLALPAYWLWCISDGPGAWSAIALGVLVVGVLLMSLRCRWIYKYK